MSDIDQGQATTSQPVGGQQEAPSLTVTDLGNLRAIIEIAAQRGAFKAPEMEAVGNCFNKLAKFLDHVSPKKDEGAEQPTA